MLGHNEPCDDVAVYDVALHDFSDVGFSLHLIPHTFRINHHTGPLGAMIEAASFIGAHDVFQVQPLRFLFKAGVERLRSKLGAAPTGIVGAPLIGADEDMSFKS